MLFLRCGCSVRFFLSLLTPSLLSLVPPPSPYLLHYHDYGCELDPLDIDTLIQTAGDAESFFTPSATAGAGASASAGAGGHAGTARALNDLKLLRLELKDRNPAHEGSWQGKLANIAKTRVDVERGQVVDIHRYLPNNEEIRARAYTMQGQEEKKKVARAALVSFVWRFSFTTRHIFMNSTHPLAFHHTHNAVLNAPQRLWVRAQPKGR